MLVTATWTPTRAALQKSEVRALFTAGALAVPAGAGAAAGAAAAVMLRVCTDRPAKKGIQTLSGCRWPPGADGKRARLLRITGLGSANAVGGAPAGGTTTGRPAPPGPAGRRLPSGICGVRILRNSVARVSFTDRSSITSGTDGKAAAVSALPSSSFKACRKVERSRHRPVFCMALSQLRSTSVSRIASP